jgi:hypothetical protein
VSDFFPVLAWADLQGLRRRLARLLARMHRLFDAEVDRRLRGREAGEPRKEHDDFLDVLLDVAARDGAKADLDRDTLRALFTVTIDTWSHAAIQNTYSYYCIFPNLFSTFDKLLCDHDLLFQNTYYVLL